LGLEMTDRKAKASRLQKTREFLDRNRVFVELLGGLVSAGVIAVLGLVIAFQANVLNRRVVELTELEALPYFQAFVTPIGDGAEISSRDYSVHVANRGGVADSIEVFPTTYIGITGLDEDRGDWWTHVYIPCNHHLAKHVRESVSGIVYSLTPREDQIPLGEVFREYMDWANASGYVRYAEFYCTIEVRYRDRTGLQRSERFRLGSYWNQRIRYPEAFPENPDENVNSYGLTGVLDCLDVRAIIDTDSCAFTPQELSPELLEQTWRKYAALGRAGAWRFDPAVWP